MSGVPVSESQAILGALRREVADLPALSDVVERVLSVTSSPDSSVRDLEAVVASDPALSARILRAANSGLYAIPQRTTSLAHACAILGFRIIRSLSLSISIMETLSTGKSEFSPLHFRKHSLAVGAAARSLAIHYSAFDPETAFTAGLLHDIGKLLLSRVAAARYDEVIRKIGAGVGFLLAEREVLGVDHAEVGGMMLSHWRIPDELAHAVLTHHDPDIGGLGELIARADGMALSLGYLSTPKQKYSLLKADGELREIDVTTADAVHAALMDGETILS